MTVAVRATTKRPKIDLKGDFILSLALLLFFSWSDKLQPNCPGLVEVFVAEVGRLGDELVMALSVPPLIPLFLCVIVAHDQKRIQTATRKIQGTADKSYSVFFPSTARLSSNARQPKHEQTNVKRKRLH